MAGCLSWHEITSHPQRIWEIPVYKAAIYGFKIVCMKSLDPEKISKPLLVTESGRTELFSGRGLYSNGVLVYVGCSMCESENM